MQVPETVPPPATVSATAVAGVDGDTADSPAGPTAAAAAAASSGADTPPATLTPKNSTSAAPAVAPTPLEQRQWQRLAQRSVRLAVTAFKDAETRVLDATVQGTAVATQLTNCLLTERYLPSTELPGILKCVDALQQAAVDKLRRQQQQHLQQLEELLEAMHGAVKNTEAAVTDLDSNLSPSAPWQHSLAVFHTLTLPETRDILLQIVEMCQQELQSKQGLLDSYRELLDPSSSSSSSSGGGGGRKGLGRNSKSMSVEELRTVLTAAVATWMVRPYINGERVEHLLQVLTDEMAGF